MWGDESRLPTQCGHSPDATAVALGTKRDSAPIRRESGFGFIGYITRQLYRFPGRDLLQPDIEIAGAGAI